MLGSDQSTVLRLQWRLHITKGVSIMIEFPLILIGYALLPIIAFQLMILADRPKQKGDQNAFPQVEIL